jgi:hypothetical protein
VVRPWVAWKLNADDLQTVCFPRRPGGGQAVRQICTVAKITHGRDKLEDTGAGERVSGKEISRIAEQLARCKVKCNAKVTQSVLVVDELALRVCWGESEFGTQLVTARPKGLLD